MLTEALNPDFAARLTEKQRFALKLISGWDFSAVVECVRLRMNWDVEHAQKVTDEYKKFLGLIAVEPHGTFGMAGSVDEVWHDHILDTLEYATFCNEIFGKYIHHVRNSRQLTEHNYYEAKTLPSMLKMYSGQVSDIWPTDSESLANAKCCNDHIDDQSPSSISGRLM